MANRILDWFGFGGGSATHGPGDGYEHGHDHGHGSGHGHTHGVVDPRIAATDRGIWAVKWSFVILAITAILQLAVVFLSHSVALLADTIHNFGDATTAIPLWIAFAVGRRKPSSRFTYGLGRVEDLAGLIVVLIILASAIVAFIEAINRFIHPQPLDNLAVLALAGVVGFVGNEAVAVFRIRVGREMHSAALVADGYHARTDGLTSLAVVLGAIGVALGFPLADPLIGLVITIAILGIVWQSAGAVLSRMLDGVEPSVLEDVRHAAGHVEGIRRVADVRARWLGHRLVLETAIEVDDSVLLAAANAIADSFRHELTHHIPALDHVSVTFSPPVAPADHHHHAPSPVRVAGRLADGLLEIIDTPDGERFRLRVARHAEGLSANVRIARPERTEELDLVPVTGNHHELQSRVAPAEPHEFEARLELSAAGEREELPFAMTEPEGHHH